MTRRDSNHIAVLDTPPDRYLWWRGPAELDGDYLLLDVTRGEEYEPFEGDTPKLIARALQEVHEPADAVSFVERFGPLRVGFRQEDGDFMEIAGYAPPTWHADPCTPVDDILHHADAIRGALGTAVHIRKAYEGRKRSLSYLRETVAPAYSKQHQKDDHAFLMAVSTFVGHKLSAPLSGHAQPSVFAMAPPGKFTLGIRATALLAVAYWGASLTLLAQRLDICRACGKTFEVLDARQKHCSTRCGDRVRQQKHRANRPGNPRR